MGKVNHLLGDFEFGTFKFYGPFFLSRRWIRPHLRVGLPEEGQREERVAQGLH